MSAATWPSPSDMKISGTGAQRARGQLHGLAQELDEGIHAGLDPTETVGIAVVPGRVGVDALLRETGEVARGDGLEAGTDSGDVVRGWRWSLML